MIKTTVGRTYNLGNYENIYIEIVQDGDSGADPQRLLKEAEQEVKKFFESYKNPKLETKGGLVETEFQRVLDEYVWEKGTMDSEEYANMNLEQQSIIQTIKKSKNRQNYKLNK